MILTFVRRLRVCVLILIAFSVLAGAFPGQALKLIGVDAFDQDAVFMLGAFYGLTFVLFFIWLLLVALERRLKTL